MGDPSADLPAGKVTKFDKASYQKLTSFVNDVNTEMEAQFLKPSTPSDTDFPLNQDSGTYLSAGSPQWTPAKTVSTRAGTFGGSVHDQLGKMSTEWSSYVTALNKAVNVFEKTDDLATMSASDFESKYPGLSDSGGGSTGS